MELKDIPHIDELSGIDRNFESTRIIKDTRSITERSENSVKVLSSIQEAIRATGLKDGMTISFHHHFRNGDYVLNMVLDEIAAMGIRDLTLAPSSLQEIHEPLIEHIKQGVVRRIETSGLRGKLAGAISHGLMEYPVVFRSHGGRAYAIETGKLKIDVAFLGAPACDPFGNANGYSREDDHSVICGSLGYAKCDAQYADQVVIVTDNIVPFPNAPFGIPESDVTYIVKVDKIGDPNGIMSGATRFTKNPKDLIIAEQAANVIEASGKLVNGFSIQMGSGGASLAITRFLEKKMIDLGVKASFALGGITGSMVSLFEKGLVKKLLDVQSFDLDAAKSLINNRFHQQISASYYASPGNQGCAVNQLDIVILSAMEVDLDFNVNVLTGSDGIIRGAIGGHCDTAAGASLSIIVCPLCRGRIPSIVRNVNTIVTPGRTIDVIVTDQGVAVNPDRKDLEKTLKERGIPVRTIEELYERAEKIAGRSIPIRYTDKIVGVVTYRDGSIIDVVRQVDEQ
ncbi:MAG: citrate lyase subunit alpha [Spirochaetia bacterium]|nr:citrate lyase subunit alpha [Spirochaetia bacterium]